MTQEEELKSLKEAFARIPADQRFTYRVTPLPGRLMNADMIGKQLEQLSKIFAALGKDIDPGKKWITGLLGCGMEEDGSVRFDLTVMRAYPPKRKPSP